MLSRDKRGWHCQAELGSGAGSRCRVCAVPMRSGRDFWLDAEAALWEATVSIRRAGADLVVTYAARELARRARALAGGAPA